MYIRIYLIFYYIEFSPFFDKYNKKNAMQILALTGFEPV